MTHKYLDYDGLLYFWQKLKAYFVADVTYNSTSKKIQKTKAGATSDVVTLSTVATSGSYNDLSNKPTIPSSVEKSTTTPKMDGTASVGSETKFAAGDHVHPTDTSRVPTTRTINGKALSDNITLTGADIYSTNTFNSDALSDVSYNNMDDVFSAVDEWIDNAEDELDDKVDKVEGKGLSTNDYTTADKNKLDGIASGANKVTYSTSTHTGDDKYSETMVQITKSDGSVSRFYTPTTDVATTTKRGLMSPTDKSKLDGIASGAEVNVNADWNATSGDAQILNKPTLGTAASKDVVTSISGDSANLPTVTAVKNYVQTAVTGAVAFQGTAPTTFAPTNYKAGYYWVVGTAGTYVGQVCEAGDMIFATADGTSYSASDFDVVQTNLDITAITNAEIDTIMAS